MDRILPDFLVSQPEGYYCRYGDFFVDPTSPVNRAVISHAHGDHATPGHQSIHCTPATAAFMKHRFRRQSDDSFRLNNFHESFVVNGISICFIPAGHMLGSAQLLMEYRGVRYLFTGDYKLQADETCEPLEVVQADVLITESTFANPDVQHPNPIREITKINDRPHNILLGTYALGKAQRLTALINRYCPSWQVLVHHNILPLHRIYESHGKQLRYDVYTRREMKAGPKNKIYLVPPMTFNSYFRATDVVRIFASGWKHLHRHNDVELYISDHVDWQGILKYVQAVNPMEIWTMHGEGRHLAKHFEGNIQVKAIG